MVLKFKAGNGSETLPEGSFDATLAKVEECRNADGNYLRWTFAVSQQGKAQNVTGLSPANLDSGRRRASGSRRSSVGRSERTRRWT